MASARRGVPRAGRATAAENDAAIAARNVTSEEVVQTITTATRLKSLIKASTQRLHDAALESFKTFLGKLRGGTADAVQTYRTWAGGGGPVNDYVYEDTTVQLTPAILHGWALDYASKTIGRIVKGVKKPLSLHSMLARASELCAAFARLSGKRVESGTSISLFTYVKTTLKQRLGLPDVHRDRRTPDANVLIAVLSELFNPSFPIYYNIARIQTPLVLNMQAASSSRIGAIIRTSAPGYEGPEHDRRAVCARHVEVFIGRAGDGGHNHIRVEFELEFTKTSTGKDMKYPMYEFDRPLFNGPLLLVIVGLAQSMFEGDPTLQQVLAPASVPEDKEWVQLRWKGSVLDDPILQNLPAPENMKNVIGDEEVLGAPCIASSAMRASGYNRVLKNACTSAGYPVHFASHDMRGLAFQAALADKSNRIQEIQYSAGHNVLGDKWTRYLRSKATVDFQSAILGGASASQLAGQSFNRMQQERNPEAMLYLPRQSRVSIFQDPTLRKLQWASSRMKAELQRKYGSVKKAPPEEHKYYMEAYADWDSRYRLLYSRHRRQQLEEYHRRMNSAHFPVRSADTDSSDSTEAYDQALDSLPTADAAEGDVEAAMSSLINVDFEDPTSILGAFGTDEAADTFVGQLRDGFIADLEGDTSGDAALVEAMGAYRDATGASPGPGPSTEVGRASARSTTLSGRSATLPSAGSSSSGATAPRPRDAAPSTPAPPSVATRARRATATSSSTTSPLSPATNSTSRESSTPSSSSTVNEASTPRLLTPLQQLHQMSMDPTADKLVFGSLLLDLPAKGSDADDSFYPTMAPVRLERDGRVQPACPVPSCFVTAEQLAPGQGVPAKRLNALRKHVYKHMESEAVDSALDLVVQTLDQGQPCPFCLERERGTDDEATEEPAPGPDDEDYVPPSSAVDNDDTDEDVAPSAPVIALRRRSGRAARGLYRPSDESADAVRGPFAWYQHLLEHDLDTCCGVHFASQRQRAEHLLTHNILATANDKANSYTGPIKRSNLNTPIWTLDTSEFVVDPRDQLRWYQAEYNRIFQPDTASASRIWPTHPSVHQSTEAVERIEDAEAQLNALVGAMAPAVESEADDRYAIDVKNVVARIVSKHGWCFFCAHDKSKSWEQRMTPWLSEVSRRRHVYGEFLQLWADGRGTPNALYSCPDPHCYFAGEARLTLPQLYSHANLNHLALTGQKSKAGIVVAIDWDDFEAQLRQLYEKGGSQLPVKLGLITGNPGGTGRTGGTGGRKGKGKARQEHLTTTSDSDEACDPTSAARDQAHTATMTRSATKRASQRPDTAAGPAKRKRFDDGIAMLDYASDSD